MRNDPFDPTMPIEIAADEEAQELRTDESMDMEMERARERHEEQLRNLEVVMSALRAERNEREARSERDRMERDVARRNGVRDGRVGRPRGGNRGGRANRGGNRGVRGGPRGASGRGRGTCGDDEDYGLVGLFRSTAL